MNRIQQNAISERPSFLDNRRGRIFVILVFWTAIAIVTAILSHIGMVSREQSSSFYRWLAECLLAWYGWLALTPLIFWLGRRFMPGGPNLRCNILILGLAGAVLSTVQISCQCFTSMLVMNKPLEKYSALVVEQLEWLGPWNFLIYAGVLGAGLAREFQLRWRERQIATSRLEVELAQTQLAALRAQIQPHFFFNTLNSISVLIQKGESNTAQETLSRLGELLRFSFSLGNRQMIPLKEEIAFVADYLEIERLRCGDRLQVEIQIDPACTHCNIPPFLIQPLVENAVRHGLADKEGTGKVSLRCNRMDSALEIVVEDNGTGFPKEMSSGRAGVGLANVRSRLQRQYGTDFSFDIVSRPHEGSVVKIRIADESLHEGL